MDINKFLTEVQNNLKGKMNTDIKIKVQEVRKNNNVIYYGLIIQRPEHNIAPTIYLNAFYDMYRSGMEMEEVVKCIMDIYKKGEVKESIDMDFFCRFEEVKDKIAYRLINAERNKELLEQIPHILFMDLAICFYYAFYQEELGEGMILIHNTHMEMWGTNHKELMKLAEKNTGRMLPPNIVSMKTLLRELFEESADPGLYVLTNEKKCQGAAVLLYPHILEEAAERLGGNFYVLPSSIHEVILLKERGGENADSLKDMIREANNTQVATEEVLSDYPYYYDAQKKKLTIIRGNSGLQ
ncbi:MAG: hypothetical protein IKK33_01140 [Lachnospiraceae bacterium]|nr:hypothetical protein [Lachnospiraceae bacterium]